MNPEIQFLRQLFLPNLTGSPLVSRRGCRRGGTVRFEVLKCLQPTCTAAGVCGAGTLAEEAEGPSSWELQTAAQQGPDHCAAPLVQVSQGACLGDVFHPGDWKE